MVVPSLSTRYLAHSLNPFRWPSLSCLYFRGFPQPHSFQLPSPIFQLPCPYTEPNPINAPHSIVNLHYQPLTTSENSVLSKGLSPKQSFHHFGLDADVASLACSLRWKKTFGPKTPILHTTSTLFIPASPSCLRSFVPSPRTPHLPYPVIYLLNHLYLIPSWAQSYTLPQVQTTHPYLSGRPINKDDYLTESNRQLSDTDIFRLLPKDITTIYN